MGVSKTWAARLGLSIAVAFLAVQAMGGRHGMLSLLSLKEREAALIEELAALRTANSAREVHIAALRGATATVAQRAERADPDGGV